MGSSFKYHNTEENEDTKGEIRTRKSKTDRQQDGQRKRTKGQ
jgi:hypothetical protein